MTKKEENKLTMYKAVLALLQANGSKTASIPAFANILSQFQAAVQEIEQKHREHQTRAKGAAQQKAQLEDEMVDSLVLLAGAMYVYGVQQQDEELKALTRVSESSFKRLRDTDLLNRARSLYSKAEALAANLGDYGIDEARLTAIKEQIDAYAAALENREMVSAEKTAARQALSQAFDQADEILTDMLDPIMEMYRTQDQQFYNQYQSARVIKDL